MATRPLAQVPTPDPRNDIRKLEQTFQTAFNANDLKTVVNTYAPDAVLLPPNHAACEGAEQIGKFFQEMTKAGASNLHLEVGRIETSGDLITYTGRYRYNAPTGEGGTRPDRGNYLVVCRRQRDGNLRIVFDTFNSELPE